jgi:hypothetical protein
MEHFRSFWRALRAAFCDERGLIGIRTQRTTIVRKTANETVNDSSTLQDDDSLLYALAANEVVIFTASIAYNSNTTADIKFAFTVPASATLEWGYSTAHMIAAGTALEALSITSSGSAAALTGRGAQDQHILITGTVANGANAGNLRLQWAQDTANASDTIVRAHSWLRVEEF